MNTKPTPKRFDIQKWRESFKTEAGSMDGSYIMGLVDPETCRLFALFVTSFTELEHHMERFVARIMGVDHDVASITMRSIVSIQARIELMEAVLQRARRNIKRSSDFDEILAEFKSIKKIRNDYVHGRWQTRDDNKVFVTKLGGDPLNLDLFAAEVFDKSVFESAIERTSKLLVKIYRIIGRDIAEEQKSKSAPT